ncbi:hypothetical protein FHETE_5397 [Fusarium heterosporum]|uniref:Uncharacterized protein n=1 Tax=Fusarium heterosporum TaxID=42747 RepID=A0A8H5WQ60_FUSHE|nr:hypothetical protein FHETE_5397 [Fusarium heterosporum]
MSSPSSFTTLVSQTTTIIQATSTPTPNKPVNSDSDKIAIIGLTIGLVVLFILFIVPCCCFQWLAHWQEKRMKAKEATKKLASRTAGAARSERLAEELATMSSSHIFPRLSTTDTHVIVAIFSAIAFMLFLGVVLYFTWRSPRPQTPSVHSRDSHDSAIDEEEAERFYAFRIVQPSFTNALGQNIHPSANRSGPGQQLGVPIS